MIEAFVLSLLVVALAEFGDKTQLLVLVLAHRFRRPYSIAAGMLLAFLAAHSLAAFGGVWLDRLVPQPVLDWLIGLGFIGMGVWTWMSRGHSTHEAHRPGSARNAFVAALVVFFLMEFGDKSQLATLGLAAAFEPAWLVALGAATGATLINLPAVWLGHRIAPGIRFFWFRCIAAIVMMGIGAWFLLREALGLW